MSERRLDEHLAIDTERSEIVCRKCGERLCDASENYKRHALCDRSPLTEAGPLLNDPADYVDDEFEFRRYYCPGCAVLLESEVILAELEPTHDKELLDPTEASE